MPFKTRVTKDFLSDKPFLTTQVLNTYGDFKSAINLYLILLDEKEKNKKDYFHLVGVKISKYKKCMVHIKNSNIDNSEKKFILFLIKNEFINSITTNKKLSKLPTISSHLKTTGISIFRETIREIENVKAL